MGKPLILAEKPAQAMKYAEAIGSSQKKNGYIEIGKNALFPDGAILTWGVGHLVTLAEPSHYKKEWGYWNKEALASFPIKPEKYEFMVAKGKEQQFGIVEELLKGVQEVIIATDCDREGENIAWTILEKANATDKRMKRLWINSLEEDVVVAGFKNLKDASDYYPKYIEAQTRQISDWLIGMNLSKIYTINMKEKGLSGNFSIGRVQTPTLFMIYEREKAIQNFKQQTFYELNGTVKHPNGTFEVKSNMKSDSEMELIETIDSYGLDQATSYITKLEEKIENEKAPKLYTLSGIQTKANKMWKYSTKKTMQIVQSLYEKKLLTYPRTDTPYITTSEFDYLLANLEHYGVLLDQTLPIMYTEPRKGYVEPDKVQEHYAIIPTKRKISMNEIRTLSKDEQNIYLEVVMNTVCMFCKNAEYAKTNVEIDYHNILFKASGRVELEKGWKAIFSNETDDKKKKEPTLPAMKQGDQIQLKGGVKEGKTKPPKRFTEGDLINLMKNAGKHVEEEDQAILKETEGLGTEATRSNIIETLKAKEYMSIDKNLVYCTPKGELLSSVVQGTLLSSPSMTAQWEKYLSGIGKGEKQQSPFIQNIHKFVLKMMDEAPGIIEQADTKQYQDATIAQNTIAPCPSCKEGFIQKNKEFYGCTRYKEGCKQTFPFKMGHKAISEAQMKKILVKGKSDLMKNLQNKDKSKTFDAYLEMVTKENNRYQLQYQFQKTGVKS